MASNEIKAARNKESHSGLPSALADSGGFLDDSVLAAIRQAAARLNPRQSARKPAVSETASAGLKPATGQPFAASEDPSAGETPAIMEKRLVGRESLAGEQAVAGQGPSPVSADSSLLSQEPAVRRPPSAGEKVPAGRKAPAMEKPPATRKSPASHKPAVGRHAGPVRNRPHRDRQAPPKHAAA